MPSGTSEETFRSDKVALRRKASGEQGKVEGLMAQPNASTRQATNGLNFRKQFQLKLRHVSLS